MRKIIFLIAFFVVVFAFPQQVGKVITWGVMKSAEGVVVLMQPGIDRWAEGMQERSDTKKVSGEVDDEKQDGKWQTYERGALYVEYPKEWVFLDYMTITNIPIKEGESLEKNLRSGEVRLTISGGPVDQIESERMSAAQQMLDDFVQNQEGTCRVDRELVSGADGGFASCTTKDTQRYLQIQYLEDASGSAMYGANYISVRAENQEVFSANQEKIRKILSSIMLFNQPFMP